MKVGLNGSIVESSEAVISVYDHGFLYGLGLFETFRTYGGRSYLLERHMERLLSGCAQLGIEFSMSVSEIEDWVARLLEENGLPDGYVRLTVSAGEAALGLPTGDYEHPTSLLLVKELPVVQDDVHFQGRELRLLHIKRNTPEGSIRFKSLHYMNNTLAKRELLGLSDIVTGNNGYIAPMAGAEGLMLTEAGWLTEGIVSNLFFVSDGVVRTPSIDTGILPGVTRQRVLELAADAGYRTEEGLYPWETLLRSEEIWMTNSIQELVPITTLTDTTFQQTIISDGKAGEVTRKLLSLYRADTTR
ncbi:aminotransferase class IV [Paenibacillus sp. GSMTC-2017]|uniref:aminotransferase class IV n=1 Tax=Paenibacillus sp. GSMTC-2017 TaxID=2794350 RepID=UPI0018D690DC|nr:aminotransferase class IV [Paenibacillus sp. GSMTC-2017]MBH5320674.1 aminotransferase class IV [Paenibacillus sp. GSMTC-2017]